MGRIVTLSTDFALTHATDATDTSFPSKVPTVTKPSGDGVIVCGDGGSETVNGLQLIPVGTGQNDMVLTGMRLLGWRRYPGKSATKKDLWVPFLLAEFAGVYGSATGVDASSLASTYFFADTITQVTGNANVSNEILSPTGNIIGHVVADLKGAQLCEVTFDLGANMTGANCLYAKI